MTEKQGPLTVRAMGMPWYRAEDFPRILEIMDDAHKLHATHEQWRTAAELGEREMQRKGLIVIRAIIDPDAFTEWCREKGMKLDAKARGLYASWVAMREVKQTH